MTPLEIAAKAHHETHCTESWEVFKQLSPKGADLAMKRMRAALLALAEAEPTVAMMYQATIYKPKTLDDGVKTSCKAYIRAAANDGDE